MLSFRIIIIKENNSFIIAKQERLIVLHVGQFLLPLSLAFWATKRSNNRSAVAIRATERRSLRLHLYSEIDQGATMVTR